MPKARSAPSTPTKITTSRPYPRTPTTPRKDLAKPKGGSWIFKSDAKKLYKLPQDALDEIKPIEDRPNPRGGGTRIQKYNLVDVEELAERVHGVAAAALPAYKEKSAARDHAPPTPLATPKGPRVLRTAAMNRFGLTAIEMDTITPVSVQPNPHNARSTMRHYNQCDVEDLAQRLAKTPKSSPVKTPSPTRPARASTSRSHMYDDLEDELFGPNPFDGLSGRDAAYKFAELTGISGPAMAYEEDDPF